jgi:uncharacterized peroxidase-related enzyme
MTTLIPVVEENEAVGEVAQAYAQYREQFGRTSVPGILKCFATHPPLLQQMLALAPSLLFNDGCLDRKRKEMIATYVSGINDCTYCLDSHASFLRTCGGSEGLVTSLAKGSIQDPSLDDKDRALLGFVHKVTVASQTITDRDVQAMRDAGWDCSAIAEAIHIAGLFAFFNRVVNAFGLPSQNLLGLDLPKSHTETMP